MKKLSRVVVLMLMCVLMVFSTVSISVASAIGNVKTLTLKSAASSGVSLSWSAVSKAKGYRVYRYTASEKKWKAIKTTTSKAYKDTSVKQGEVYKYRIKAYEVKNGKNVFSEKYSNTVEAVIAPQKVSGLKATSVKSTTVKLSWTKVEKATGYRVYKYNNSTKKYEKVADTTSNSYTVKSLKANTTYKFNVKAYTKSSTTKYGTASSALSIKTKPADVSSFRLASVSKDGYTLSWNKSTGVNGYQLVKYNESTGKWVEVTKTKATTYNVSGEAAAKLTKYKLRTYVKKGDGFVFGAYSSVVSASRIPAVPKNLSGAVNSDDGISLKWDKVEGASGYIIHSYSAKDGSWSTLASVTKNSYNTGKLKNTDTYRYAVSSYVNVSGAKVSSDKSESVSVFFKSEEKSDSIYSAEMEKSGILGYLYDPKEGCFYTSADPWQRVVGYNEIFDIMGPFTFIDFDTVRCRFDYKDKNWMIQLWKGQYGLVFYGAEVGVYTKPKDRELMHYDCATDSEMLKMSMTFIEKEKFFGKVTWEEKFTRPYGYYWWCTGFLPGNKYGKFDELKLDMRITMKDYEMLSGFTAALKENGITYTVRGLDVYFVYA